MVETPAVARHQDLLPSFTHPHDRPKQADLAFDKPLDRIQARADVTFSKALKGHVLYEYLKPGDFYIGRDSAYFLRFELIYSFKKIF